MIPPIASKFVAGETSAEAIEHVRALNERDVAGILNLLGEHYDDPANAAADTQSYLELIDDIGRSDVDACVSVKPSQIGLDVGADTFAENLTEIADRGAERDVFVWVDMEDHTTTDATLDAYEELVREHGGGMGLCLQANLERTREDLERLADAPGKVRIVKGAYDEPASVAYTDKDRVDENYRDLIEYMFESFDDGVAVGSHDPEFVSLARELHREHGTPYEIQMLMGVRTDAQYELAADGVEVYQYIPYGNKWFSYFYRRVRERKENLLFALRAILS
ncbi:proline dehydrogenase [Halobiforma lacisalsi AJ5]|uniref:proline dehydrogenase n=1 Tax=Natronobacterium lacisalsi AJ5 TaxID=358396 RepID=M0LR25_NATLA|nr:proline dehydrogenase family protein [Halobiforma lacisalsi]APW99795.1 proline dehydrogenase [Halobiforma lacisalsi AJ5]EMA36027.1 proline dehydrogenase [Halobiforma lacisalsi AJ5]